MGKRKEYLALVTTTQKGEVKPTWRIEGGNCEGVNLPLGAKAIKRGW